MWREIHFLPVGIRAGETTRLWRRGYSEDEALKHRKENWWEIKTWVFLQGVSNLVSRCLGTEAHISLLAPVPERRRCGHVTQHTHVKVKLCVNHSQSDSYCASLCIPETSGTSFPLTRESHELHMNPDSFRWFIRLHLHVICSWFIFMWLSPNHFTLFYMGFPHTMPYSSRDVMGLLQFQGIMC